jgi:hypothetical protein
MGCIGRPVAAVFWVTAVAVAALPTNLQAHREQSEQELETRVQQEKDPLKKAKLEIELGTLRLDKAGEAYAHDDVERGAKLLDSCKSGMQEAWALLEASGRDAAHKPQGFKDLDIALREGARKLQDLRRGVPSAERAAIEHTAKDLEAVHDRVLSALFPGGQLADSPPPAAPQQPSTPPPSGLRSGEPHP